LIITTTNRQNAADISQRLYQPMSGVLQQLNISYNPVEDRLLLRANAGSAGEFRVWLTRRYSTLLAKVLAEMIEKEGGMRELASSRDTITQLKEGALEQEYQAPSGSEDAKPASVVLPLGADGILGYRISTNRKANGVLNLQLLPSEGSGLNFDLNRTMLFMFYNLLEQGLVGAEWNVHLPQTHKEPVH
jgi:hypothetical protein